MNFEKKNNAILSNKMVLLGLGSYIFFWMVESSIHFLVSQDVRFFKQLFSSDPNKIWMHFVVFSILIFLSIYAQLMIRKRRKAEEIIKKSHDELEHRIDERTNELRDVSENFKIELENRNQIEAMLKNSEVKNSDLLEELNESEERFQGIFEQDAVGIAHVSTNGSFIRINQRLCDILGYTREEMLERTFQDIALPEDLEAYLAYVRQMLAGEIQTFSMEKRFIKKDTSIVWVSPIVSLMRDYSGEPKYFISIIKDITKQKRIEEEVNVQKQELILLFEDIDEIVMISDPETYELLYVNKKTKKLFGRDIIGKTCYQALQGLDKPCETCPKNKIFGKNMGKPHVWEYQNKTNKRWYRCIDKSINWPGRRTVHYQLAINIHERKLAEEELKKSENRYRILAENMADGVGILQDGKLTFVNTAFGIISGYTTKQLVDIDLVILFHDEHKMRFSKVLESYEKGLHGEPFQVKCLRKDTQEFWAELRPCAIQWKGRPATLVTFRDITEFKRQEMAAEEEKRALQRENVKLLKSLQDRFKFGDLVGKSTAMHDIYEHIMKASSSNATVIIYGESGTGKDLIARTIHNMSTVSKKKFVPVNCGAIPESLFESEFFGHQKGAFTGAHVNKYGFFDLANKGTLFLDEVGELPLHMQVKLLRAIEDGGYMPVGGNQIKHADLRIIAATNRELSDMVRNGYLREDFYYRIHVIPITVPPLRDRKGDIPLLVEHFLPKQDNKQIRKLSGKIIDSLCKYDWPGNVRELQNVLQRYLITGELNFQNPLTSKPAEQEQTFCKKTNDSLKLHSAVEKLEKTYIIQALNRNGWNKSNAAVELGISRKTLFTKIKNLEVDHIQTV